MTDDLERFHQAQRIFLGCVKRDVSGDEEIFV